MEGSCKQAQEARSQAPVLHVSESTEDTLCAGHWENLKPTLPLELERKWPL